MSERAWNFSACGPLTLVSHQCPPTHSFICPSTHPSSIHLSIHPPFHPSIHLLIYPLICLPSIYPSSRPSIIVCPFHSASIQPSRLPSTYPLSIFLSLLPSVCLSFHMHLSLHHLKQYLSIRHPSILLYMHPSLHPFIHTSHRCLFNWWLLCPSLQITVP